MKSGTKEYYSLHYWVRTNAVKPDNCEDCGKLGKLDWANISGQYKKDLSDFMALCRSCHFSMDRGKICRKGHLLTGDNVYNHPKGSRICRTCKHDSRIRYYLKKGK